MLQRVCRWFPFAVLAALTSKVWLLGESYFLRDFWTNYVPGRFLQRQTWLQEGAPLLWNRWIGGGLPVLAEPNGSVLYPLSWPLLLPTDQAWAFSLLIDLHLALGAWGMYRWARTRLGVEGAAAAAAALALGGVSLSNRTNGQWLLAAMWAPWFFLALLRCLESPTTAARLRWAVALAGVWALQLLAADPQLVYLEGLAAGVAALGGCEDTPSRRQTRRSAWPVGPGPGISSQPLSRGRRAIGPLVALAVASVVAVLWAAPQLLPMAESFSLVDRPPSATAGWAWSAWRAWEWLLPMPWGSTWPTTAFSGQALTDPAHSGFYFASLYLGALLLPSLGLGLARLRRSDLPWLAGAALLVAASTGALQPLLELLPVWKVFRYPERLWLLPSLGAAFWMGRGVDALGESSRRAVATWLGATAALAALAWLAPRALGPTLDAQLTALVVPASALHALTVLGAAALALALPPVWRPAVWALLIPLDCAVALRSLEATWVPPTVPAESSGRRLVLLGDLQKAVNQMPSQAEARRRFETLLLRPNVGAMVGVEATNGISSLELRRAAALRKGAGQEAAARHYGTAVLVAREGLVLPGYRSAAALGFGLTRYEAQPPPPLAVAFGDAQTVEGPEAAAAAVKAGRHAVEAPAVPAQPGEEPCEVRWSGSRAATVSCAPKPWPRWVRWSENHYPGWRAQGAPAVAVDAAFLGGLLPADATSLGFEYTPTHWAAGWVAHLAGWLVALGLLLRGTSPRPAGIDGL